MFLYTPVISILLILFAYYLYHKNHKANLYLSLYFITISFGLFIQLIFVNSTNAKLLAICYLNFSSIYLLPGPFLYFYVRGIVWDKPVQFRKDWIHFIPFLFFLVLVLPWIFTSYATKLSLMEEIIADRNLLLSNRQTGMPISIGMMYVLRPVFGLVYILYTLVSCIRYYNRDGMTEEMIRTRTPLSIYTLLIFQLIMFLLHFFNAAIMVNSGDVYSLIQRGAGSFIFITQALYFIIQVFFGTLLPFVMNGAGRNK